MGSLIRAALAAALVATCPAVAGAAAPSAPKPPANDDCLACHSDPTAKRADGSAVVVDPKAFAASTHAPLACVDCHADLATLQEFPHADKLAKANCAACHDGAQEKYTQGAHAMARQGGQMLAATCIDCHGKHDIRPASDPSSPTSHLNLPQTCAKCHGSADIIKRGHIQIGDVASKYHDSIHGRAVERSGLLVAPACVDCHGNHDIKRRTDATSLVFRKNIPTTCGKCHAGILQHYDESVHGAALKQGSAEAPVCADCHTAHSIQRIETEAWRLSVTTECGTCHAVSMRTFRDTFHGQVTSLGFVRVAACADCHGSHDIFRKADARSRVSSAKLVDTCKHCHKGASASFVRYDPHADRHDPERNPTLYFAAKFMDFLLIAVFTFFGIHTLLWLLRATKARRDAGPDGTEPAGRER